MRLGGFYMLNSYICTVDMSKGLKNVFKAFIIFQYNNLNLSDLLLMHNHFLEPLKDMNIYFKNKKYEVKE